MMWVDAHTHHLPDGADATLRALVNLDKGATIPDTISPHIRFSVGLHPWEVTPDWQPDFEPLRHPAEHPLVVAIGETGLDRLRGAEIPLQEEAFRAHIQLSETLRKPLIVHCVKAADTLLHLRKRLRPQMPWLYHGFRGTPALARQLLDAGIDLSFGIHANPEAARCCPLDRMTLETDDSALDIRQIYQQMAAWKGISPEKLAQVAERSYFCTIIK